jgi:hypothetical protein
MWVPGGVGGSALRLFEDGVPRLDCISLDVTSRTIYLKVYETTGSHSAHLHTLRQDESRSRVVVGYPLRSPLEFYVTLTLEW